MERELKYVIPPEYDGRKLITYLRGGIGLSYRLVRSLKQKKESFILDGKTARTIDKLKAGSQLTIMFPKEEATAEAMEYPLDILYEDEDILVINKPAGLAMHPTHNHQGDTLANAVSYYLQSRGKSAVFRACGRLDKNTSGIVICALNKHSSSVLSGKCQKEYLAVVEGKYTGSGTIDKPIIRPDPMKTLRSVGEGGERAVTHWECLISEERLSLLKIRLETGRTHQIRVHFVSMGTPLAGDEMYGGSTELISRHALHCCKVCLIHPVTGEEMEFEAELPDDMKKLINHIQSTS